MIAKLARVGFSTTKNWLPLTFPAVIARFEETTPRRFRGSVLLDVEAVVEGIVVPTLTERPVIEDGGLGFRAMSVLLPMAAFSIIGETPEATEANISRLVALVEDAAAHLSDRIAAADKNPDGAATPRKAMQDIAAALVLKVGREKETFRR